MFDIKKFINENKVILRENQDWQEYFWKQIFSRLKGKGVGEWTLDPQHMMGSVSLESRNNPDIFFFATPYWEGKEGIDVQIYIEGNKDVFSNTFPFKFTGDPRKDMDDYLKALKNIINGSWVRNALKKLES